MSFIKKIYINDIETSILWNEYELKKIQNFICFANRLKGVIHRKGETFRAMSMSISAEVEQEVKFNISLPPDDDKSILLHNLRPFILQGEQTFLPSVCSLLFRGVEDKNFRKFIGNQIKKFSIHKSMQSYYINVTEEQDQTLNSDEVLKLWLNAYEYHRDEDKIERIKTLTSFLPYNLFEFIMINALLDKTNAILEISNACERILNPEINKIEITRSNI